MQKAAVVGSGLIGAYLALKLKEKGLDVFLYDQKKEEELGFKPCSTLVSERIRQFIAFPENCIENIIEGCKIHFPKKTIELNFNPKHLVLNRDKLLQSQLSLLKEKGINLFLGQRINDIPWQYDYVFGCDGPASVIRRKLGLKEPKMKIGAQVFVEKPGHSSFTDVFPVRSGFFWKIPRYNFTEYGFLASSNIKALFFAFLKEQGVGLKDIALSLVPCSGIKMIFSKNKQVALCGDAMGLTKPWSGGGIIWSLYAADILLNNFPNFGKYEKEAERFFKPKIIEGTIANNMVYFLGFNFPFFLPDKVNYDNDFPNFTKSIVDLIKKK